LRLGRDASWDLACKRICKHRRVGGSAGLRSVRGPGEEQPGDLLGGGAIEVGDVGGVGVEGERDGGVAERVLTILGLTPARSAIVA
jgi:hypothetical protein